MRAPWFLATGALLTNAHHAAADRPRRVLRPALFLAASLLLLAAPPAAAGVIPDPDGACPVYSACYDCTALIEVFGDLVFYQSVHPHAMSYAVNCGNQSISCLLGASTICLVGLGI